MSIRHHIRQQADIHHQHIQIILLGGAIVAVAIFFRYNRVLDRIYLNQPAQLGVSYSPDYAAELGLDPHQTYEDILSQLDVKLIRLNAYWNEIEPQPGAYDFNDLDYYVGEAGRHQAKVLLTVGYKLPRWPECRAPQWLDHSDQSVREKEELPMIRTVVTRYRNQPAIYAFQVENEPLFPFGICPPSDERFLKQEVGLVHSLTDKPIILTDSGELSLWNVTMRLSDYFGTTLYRTVYDPHFGELPYPLQPWFYRIKSDVTRKLFAHTNQKIIISELQAEPWATQPITTIPIPEQIRRLSPEQMKKNVEFARQVGFDEIYLWGAEWWDWMKEQGHPQYWQYAEGIFR